MQRLLFALIISIAGVAVLVSLGNWQVRRLAEKEAILAEITARITQPPISLPANPDPVKDKYRSVVVDGVMLPGEIHVLVSLKKVGAGYRVIAPFKTKDGRRILIDRGFIAPEDKATDRALGAMQVAGNLHWPIEIDSYTPDPDRAGNIWFARDVAMLAEALKTDPILIIAKTDADSGVTPLPVDTTGIPNDHLQYAVTWYGLALVWALMSIYFLWRTRAKARGKNS
ncbi:SURF1 family protein [Phaeobacter marinintestinus]|uniref:SURF1 family protein n=1 Tax=Falsiphaeobacter marinintestinus TaxID=1492905 RepID=UPI0011B3F9A3|nr:SURF1 family protein [Phaeobacter marinintestinus]